MIMSDIRMTLMIVLGIGVIVIGIALAVVGWI